jgi:class 3 adenylate cyclase
VNAAARLVALSGGDLVLSAAVLDDPEVAELLADSSLDPIDVQLKGFDERLELYRLSDSPGMTG